MRSFDRTGRMLTEALQSNAGIDKRTDAFNAGYIACVKDLLNMELVQVKEKD